MKILENKKVAILADNGFEELELKSPKEYLLAEGVSVDVVSPQKDKIKSWDFTDWGPDYSVDVELKDANPDDYDALVLPGGVINPDSLRINPEAIQFIDAFVKAGKPVAAICHGPWTLIETGELKGKKLTSYKSIKTDLINAGVDWVDQEVVKDGNIITSRTPDDLEAFNKTIKEALS